MLAQQEFAKSLIKEAKAYLRSLTTAGAVSEKFAEKHEIHDDLDQLEYVHGLLKDIINNI